MKQTKIKNLKFHSYQTLFDIEYKYEPWNGGFEVELVGESKPGLRSGIGVTGGQVKPRRCCIPCSLIVSSFSGSKY